MWNKEVNSSNRDRADSKHPAVIRFPEPSVQVSRKTLEVLVSALEDVRLFFGLSSFQGIARTEAMRVLKSERTPEPGTATTSATLPILRFAEIKEKP